MLHYLQVPSLVATLDAWRKVLSVIGSPYKERWPDEEARIIFISTVFTYSQRLTALTFLYGNVRHVGRPRLCRRAPADASASTRATTTTRAELLAQPRLVPTARPSSYL